MNGNHKKEPKGAKWSIFPSTLHYLSCNKAPFDIPPNLLSDNDSSSMNEDSNFQDEAEMLRTSITTSKKGLPNHAEGYGDNMWAIAIVILECIFGYPVSLDYGNDQDDIVRCIRTKNFYQDFKDSKVYKEFYQDDKEFQVVDKFLGLALVKDEKKRNSNCKNFKNSDKSKTKVNQEKLTEVLSKYL